MEGVYEQFFALMYHGNWDFQQAYCLPIGLRTWFINRLKRQKEAEQAAVEGASAGNSPKRHTIPSNLPN